jgi:uncharacterized protein (TIGR02757 family)
VFVISSTQIPKLTSRQKRLRQTFIQMEGQRANTGRLEKDPLGRVHGFDDPLDQEIAALCAAQIAYGRVDLFLPVLDRLFQRMNELGGPRCFVMHKLETPKTDFWDSLSYRWTRGTDWKLFLQALRGFFLKEQSLKLAFESRWERLSDIGDCLEELVVQLSQHVHACTPIRPIPRGTRYFLVAPSGGSACKRWMLFLRWMVRPADGVDLGLFQIPASALMMPLDTHVLRIGRFLGMVKRRDASWRTAKELTTAMAAFDPTDPTRFDFALAHVGISSGCTGYRIEPPCKTCSIKEFCKAPSRPKI